MVRRWITLAAATSLLIWPSLGQSTADQDRDGLDDAFEQELLHKFAPSFLLSGGDCDVMPAEIVPDSVEPQILARNGTIYGQVFKSRPLRTSGAFIEIHYFHLWGRDCGRSGHELDVEHVSTLVRANEHGRPAAEWKAVYWYAAAHEDTLCDVSTAARAPALLAETRGPEIWVSAGKHASFFTQLQCSGGCGRDLCDRKAPLVLPKLTNVGEWNAPMNGALWIQSKRWQLGAKMTTDFDDALLAEIDSSHAPGLVALKPHLRSTQAVISRSDATYQALDVSRQNTGIALYSAGKNTEQALDSGFGGVDESLNRTRESVALAGAKTGRALNTSTKNVGKSLRTSAKNVRGFLRLSK